MQKRIRKITAPPFTIKKQNIDEAKLQADSYNYPTQTEPRRKDQDQRQTSTVRRKQPEEQQQEIELNSQSRSRVVVKKAAAGSHKAVNVAGGYTPTILARN